ncbi:MFS transporter [Thiofilum flexile]|uniref:MFS transporter n=1 Tax=Thiofilum flexile TaxID=125627 RepID=UPI000366D413|nr:MFS transporter [Thiofilum flexile]
MQHPAHWSAFGLVLSCFLALGLLFGAWQVMITDLQQALNLSPSAFGLALTCGVLGSLPAMFLTGGLADKFGARRVMAISCLLMAIVVAQLYWVDHYIILIVVIFLLLGSAGALDVAINAAAVNYEQRTSQQAMGFFHAGYSGGAAASALVTGYLLSISVPFRSIYLWVAIVVGLVGLVVLWAKPLDKLVSHPVEQTDKDGGSTVQGLGSLFRIPLLVILATIVGLTYFSEGTLEIWSAVYLRLALDLPVLLGAAGPAIFHIAMMLGRLTAGWVATHFKRRNILLFGGVMAALGMFISLITTYPPLILLGFLLTGLALAGIVPIVFSLAGEVAPERSGQVISVVTIMGYTGFLVGPALIGGLADWLGLRVALLLLIGAGIGILLLSIRLRQYLPTR